MDKIAFVTDIHFDEQFPIDYGVDAKENWRRIIADLKLRNINKIIFGGDIGAATGHSYFFKTLEHFDFHLILGNHDDFDKIKTFFNPEKGNDELYYFIEDNYSRLIFLDTSSEKLSESQMNWLKKILKTEKNVILFIHHPILNLPTAIDKLYHLKNREEIKKILENTEIPITIFSGHYHMNDERVEKNIRQIITQSSSYQIEKEADEIIITTSNFGYRILTIKQNFIETEIVNL